MSTLYIYWCWCFIDHEYTTGLSFAIPVHKTCKDSLDKEIQFVLEEAPQHQHPMMHISLFSRRVSILFQTSSRMEKS